MHELPSFWRASVGRYAQKEAGVPTSLLRMHCLAVADYLRILLKTVTPSIPAAAIARIVAARK